MIENRLVHRLERYWTLLKKEAKLPDFAQFNPSAISDIWPQCVLFVVQMSNEMAPPVVSFHTIGEGLSTIYGNDMLGKTVSASQGHFQGAKIIRRFQEVITTPQILFDEGQFVANGSTIVKYRSCLLPFSSKDQQVSHIVAGLSWREY